MVMQCATCHIALPKEAVVCPRCQAPVSRSAKRTGPVTVVLRLDDSTTFVLTGKPEYVIGRRDPRNVQPLPDVDLSRWPDKRGVSRHHAKIILSREGAFIEDLGGPNATVRNNYRLHPGQRYPIEDGDILLLGELAIWVVIRPDSGSIKP